MKILGVEFASLNIPLERRLQTAATFYFCSSFIFFYFWLGWAICLFLCLLFPPACFFVFLYLLWILYDYKICERGGRPSEWVRNWRVWKHLKDYFPISTVKTADLDPNKNYIFCYHPHGIMSVGAIALLTGSDFKKMFPGMNVRVITLNMQFYLPFNREYVLALGACSAEEKSIDWILTKQGTGQVLVIVVGGAAESLYAHPGTATLVLKRRRGFVRIALKHGVSLVPIYAFGENEIYKQTKNPEGSLLRKFQEMFKNMFGFTLPIIAGRGIFQYTFGLLPFRKPITLVIGKPLDVPKILKPSAEDIERTRNLYIQQLTNLFEEHKTRYGQNLKLKII